MTLFKAEEEKFIDFFNEVAKEIHKTAKEKGWWDQQDSNDWLDENAHIRAESLDMEDIHAAYKAGQQNPSRNEGEMLMLTVSELAEGMEGLRKDLQSDHIPGFKMIEEELADAIIRIADHAKSHNYRVAEAIIAKMKFNKTNHAI